jgi:hypothetical protein
LRQLVPHLLTFGTAVVRQREARDLFVSSVRGRLSVPLTDVVREIILLRILARIRDDGGSGGEPWSLSVEIADGTILIRTHPSGTEEDAIRLDGPFERVAWNHADVAHAVPIYPRHPQWGWIALGRYGRYEFTALGEIARTDAGTARTLLSRALEG